MSSNWLGSMVKEIWDHVANSPIQLRLLPPNSFFNFTSNHNVENEYLRQMVLQLIACKQVFQRKVETIPHAKKPTKSKAKSPREWLCNDFWPDVPKIRKCLFNSLSYLSVIRHFPFEKIVFAIVLSRCCFPEQLHPNRFVDSHNFRNNLANAILSSEIYLWVSSLLSSSIFINVFISSITKEQQLRISKSVIRSLRVIVEKKMEWCSVEFLYII